MAIDRVSDVLAAVPGARPSSTYRDPAHNRRVGGVDGSHHTRGTPDNPHAVDLVPAPGETMAQLRARVAASGVNTLELLNEGDHVHVAVDGKPRGGGEASSLTPGADSVTPEWVQSQGFDPDRFRSDTAYAQRTMQALGYVARDGQWTRDESVADFSPAPLDTAYAARQDDREALALDQEEANIMMAAQFETPGDAALRMGGAVGADILKGTLLEGGQSVLHGVLDGLNETLNLADSANEAAKDALPMWRMAQNAAVDTPLRLKRMIGNLLGGDDRRTAEQMRNDLMAEQRGQVERNGGGILPNSEAGRPETVTGNIIEGVSQFATGFVGGGKALKGWQVATRGGRIGKSMAQGALADFAAFDGNEARLSNLLSEHAPEAVGPMFSWLAASEDDPELLGRFKNSLEGAGFGGLVEVLTAGARSLRAGRQVKAEAREAAAREGLQEDPTIPLDEAAARGEELQEAVRSAMGNPAGPRVRVVPEANPVITPFQSKLGDVDVNPRDINASTDNVFDINLARINAPEDVQAVIVGMADKLAKDVDLARRGQRSWDQTRQSADKLDWVESMAARQPGDAVNAETAMAYRLALNSSATKLLDLARKVEAEPTLANQFAFRRATSVHAAIQNELMGARAEAGRALNAFRIPADAPATYLRQVDSLIADVGGANSAQELARKVLDAARKGDSALNEMVRGGAMARTREIVKLVYTNSLLSGVGTPIINVVGNGMMLGLNVMSRSLSPRMAGAFGGRASTQVGEASALIHGYQQAMRDMFRLNPLEAAQRIGDNAGEAMRSQGLFRGMAPGLDDAAPDGVRLRAEREESGMRTGRPLSAAAWRVSEDSPLGRFLDIVQMIVEAPSNLNALTDDVFKTISARGELHAQAFRTVTREGLEGEAARGRYAALMENPTDEMLAAAEREMHDLTFTRETPGMAAAVTDLRRHMDNNPTPIPFGSIVFPFLRTPANLISVGMRYSPLAPFMRRFSDAMTEGGAAAETAKAQMAIGTALWSVWMGMAMDGDITGSGPGNRGQREAMQRVDENGGTVFQPYSVRIGNRWVSYERADPMGQGMGLIADMADLLKNGDWDADRNGEWDEMAAHAVASLGQAFFDKTMLRSATEMTSALLDGTDAEAEKLLMSRASGMIPGSSALRMVRRGQDPYLRETHNVVSAIMNTVPGLSEDLPPQRDLWGRPRTYQTGLGTVYDAITPVQTREMGGSAIDYEILTHGVSVTMPARNISFQGENISLKNRPDIYSEFLRLSGEPAFEHLNAVATGEHADSEFYFGLTDGPDGGKAAYIKDVVRAYRSDARAQIVDMFADDLQSMAAMRVRRREEVRVGE